MAKNTPSQTYCFGAVARKLTSIGFKHIGINRKHLTGIAFLLMFLLLISCCNEGQESRNEVSVSGIGTVFAQPDMVQVTVNFSYTAPTTGAAKKVVDETMQRILKILQNENIEDKFIKTVSLNYYTEFEYRNGRQIVIGQRAQQSIMVTVNNIINNPERFPLLLDKITAIDRVEINNIQFDVENKAELFKKSRELAYQKAFEKAAQYAELSGRKIGKVLTITEGVSRDVAQTRATMNNMRFQAMEESASLSDASYLPAGERGVTSEINVAFLLK